MASTVPQGRDGLDVTPLSSREIEVVELATRGRTNSEIAKCLSVSTSAIKFHLSSIYRKLEVSNRTEAAVEYLRLNTQDRS